MSTSEFQLNLAVVIGINDYQNGIPALGTARQDAEVIANILETEYHYQVHLITDHQATSQNLKKWLETDLPAVINTANPSRLIFYFAGHGIALNGDDGPQGYLIPQDAKLGEVATYIPMQQVEVALAQLSCRHCLVILDCCFAGAFRWSSTRKLVPINEIIHKERYDRFIQDPAWQVITSAASDQYALDSLDLNSDRGIAKNNSQHSPFAAAFMEALSGSADVYPPATNGKPAGDGIITATELYLYLRDSVEIPTEAKNQRQTPQIWCLKKHDKGEFIFLPPGHQLNLPPAPSLDELEDNNPYRGLKSYETKDSELFFGRTALVNKLCDAMSDRHFTVVLGASGSGKSSLVKAGLIAHLNSGTQTKPTQNQRLKPQAHPHECKYPDWKALTPIRPGESPMKSLNSVLKELGASITPSATNLIDSKIFTEAIAVWSQAYPHTRLLLTIDQFEELITLCRSDLDKQEFLDLLADLVNAHPDTLRLVVTLRSDFEPQFRSTPLESLWQAARFVVPAMNREELREVIEEPASAKVVYFESLDNRGYLVDRLIDEVAGMPGALPLLSFALSELYQKLARRYLEAQTTGDTVERAITWADYDELGGVTKSLTSRADEVYDRLVKIDPAYERTIRHVMLRMVAIGGESARRQVPESELKYPQPENERVQVVLSRFSSARLLVSGTDADNQPYIEPAHDALVRGWSKILTWKKKEEENLILQQRLTPAANDWLTGKGGLWTREVDRLTRLERILDSQDNNWLNQLEIEFVQKSIQQRFDELKEAERQRDEAIQGQIGALNSLSEARFLAKDQLGAMIASVKAGKQLLEASTNVKDKLRERTQAVLRQTIYGIQERNRIQGHSGMVWDVSFSRDGAMIASANYDKTIKLWNLDGSLIRTFDGHTSDVVSVIFSADDRILASASYDKTIKLWNLDGTLRKTLKEPEGHTGQVNCISFSPDGQILASVSDDKTLKLWNLEGVLLKTINAHNNRIWKVRWSQDGKIIASTSDDNTIKLWNMNGRHLNTLKGHSGAVTDVSFSQDGNLIASASADCTIKLWNRDGKNLKTLKSHSNWVWSVSFSPDSQLIASSSWDNTVKLWACDGTLLQTLEGHSNRVWSAKFSPNSQMIASASADSTIRLWLVNSTLSKTLEGHEDCVWSVSCSANSQFIASASGDKTVKLWKPDGTLPQTLSGHNDFVDGVSISSNTQILASASADKTVKLWNFDGTLRKTLTGHADRVRNVSFSPDGQMLASTSHDHTIKLWDIHGTSPTRTLEGHSAEVIGISFSPNGDLIASTSYDRTIKLWKYNDSLWTLWKTLTDHSDQVIGVSFSPDGELLASASDDNTVKLWKCDGTLHKTLEGHSNWVFSVSFSFDSQIIASSSADRTIKLWSRDGSLLTTLQGHSDWVLGVCFSPDSNVLASASADKTVKLWNLDCFEWNLNLEELLELGNKWLYDYLKNNPNVSDEYHRIFEDGQTFHS
jgi:WD40 repeat protein/energy-coupling factor transporter ATP-binding protein EcfA2